MGTLGDWGMWSQGGHADRAFCKKSPVGLSVLGRLGYKLNPRALAGDPNSCIPPPLQHRACVPQRATAEEKRLSFDSQAKEKR